MIEVYICDSADCLLKEALNPTLDMLSVNRLFISNINDKA